MLELALTELSPQIKNHPVLLQIDNGASVSHIQKHRGTHSNSLLREVEPNMLWAERNLMDLRAMYLPCNLNIEADWLSWNFLDNNFPSSPSSPHLQSSCASLGTTSDSSICFNDQHQAAKGYLKLFLSPGGGSGCSFVPLVLDSGLRLSSAPTYLEIPLETCDSHSRPSLLPRRLWAPLAMNLSSCPCISAPLLSCLLTQGRFNHLNLEVWDSRLLTECHLDSPKAKKTLDKCIYARIWEKFVACAVRKCFDPLSPSASHLLGFFQTGLVLGLSPCSLKVQVATISAMTNTRWAESSLVLQFLKGIMRIHSPNRHPFLRWESYQSSEGINGTTLCNGGTVL